ncbi:hypothetical protein GQ55_6G250600 [Panicum hallii var. hallii]|uniref:Uncharacterized protein n=1 Tax=Panicum hallii var. hallii TaxID=1504633 RepID=A0A2T7D9D6_9POAL|nr:hypothetical protein GQ55_6G250600 [Panicum hallii var. hallii]
MKMPDVNQKDSWRKGRSCSPHSAVAYLSIGIVDHQVGRPDFHLCLTDESSSQVHFLPQWNSRKL